MNKIERFRIVSLIGRLTVICLGFALCACSPFSSITEYSTSTGAKPAAIACGFVSGNVWCTEPGVGRIAERQANGKVIEYSLARAASDPTFLALDFGEEFIWFMEPRANVYAKLCYPLGLSIDTKHNGLYFTDILGRQVRMIRL